MLYKRLELFLKQETSQIKPCIPNKEQQPASAPSKSVQELFSTFAKWRDKQITLIESCNANIWKKKADHPEYDLYTFEILVRHILLHDAFPSAAKSCNQIFIYGCF